MTLIKTSLLSFIATIVRVISGLVINKAVAIYIGPSGLALIGQLQSFIQAVSEVANGGINSGVVKYTAEFGPDGKQTKELISTAAKISLLCTATVAVILVLFSQFISTYILNDPEFDYLILILGVTITLFVLNNFLLSIINGFKEIKIWIYINISQSLYSLIFTSLLILFLGIEGALIAVVTNQSIVFFIILFFIKKYNIVKVEYFTEKYNKEHAIKLLKFSAMALTSAIVVPGSHILVRDNIVTNLGLDQAGIWQGMFYISTTYLMVITTALTTYYLPRLSEITEKNELKAELINGFKIMIPTVMLLSTLIFLMRDFIINILFTDTFDDMRDLFLWQLIGDVIKISSWLLAYQMLAKAMMRSYIITEILASCSFVLLSIAFVKNFGLIGMSYSFALNYTIYFFIVYFITKKNWT